MYYANRANAYLELKHYHKCIDDCNMAINIEPKYSKAYYRKAKALQGCMRIADAIEALEKGAKVEPGNESISQLLETLKS